MRYNADRSLTAKETLDYFSGFLNCLLVDSCLEEDREFLFDLIVENDLFRFQWSYIETFVRYKESEEVHGFPIDRFDDDFCRKDDYFECDFKNTKKIAKELINTINELSELPTL